MDRKWKNVVLSQEEYEMFRTFIKENNIQYEPSGYGKSVYVSLFINDVETEMLQNYLDKI